MIAWIFAIIAVEAITEIIIEGDIFLRFRSWIIRKSYFLGSLFSCGFCFSVWVSAPIGWCLNGVISGILVFDIIIRTFVLWRIATIWHELLSRWFNRHPISFGFNLRVFKNDEDDLGIMDLIEDEDNEEEK